MKAQGAGPACASRQRRSVSFFMCASFQTPGISRGQTPGIPIFHFRGMVSDGIRLCAGLAFPAASSQEEHFLGGGGVSIQAPW